MRSAGILLIRGSSLGSLDGGARLSELEVLLVHARRRVFTRRDNGAWSIPKGPYTPGEDARVAAAREFTRKLDAPLPAGAEWDLGEARLPSGKRLTVYAVSADLDPTQGNTIELDRPSRSSRRHSFPEVDRAEWFDLDTARRKLAKGQAEFLDRLLEVLHPAPPD